MWWNLEDLEEVQEIFSTTTLIIHYNSNVLNKSISISKS